MRGGGGGGGGGASDYCNLSNVLFSFNDVSYPNSEDSRFENNHIALVMWLSATQISLLTCGSYNPNSAYRREERENFQADIYESLWRYSQPAVPVWTRTKDGPTKLTNRDVCHGLANIRCWRCDVWKKIAPRNTAESVGMFLIFIINKLKNWTVVEDGERVLLTWECFVDIHNQNRA